MKDDPLTIKFTYGLLEPGVTYLDESGWGDFKNIFMRKVYDCRKRSEEEAIKMALISLGWTPPKEVNEN